ncbi:MAG TPA: hypothetical protein VF691_16695 [Cytophagaceae bacterium]
MYNPLKRVIYTISIIQILATACSKKTTEPKPEQKAMVKQNDQVGSAAVDGGIDDVNDIINNGIGGGNKAREDAYNLPCGVVSIDSSTVNGSRKVYKVKYGSQTPCGYKYKSGQISFQLSNGTSFSQPGAVFTITYTDYSVKILANDDVVTINGTLRITNQSGGFVWQAVTNDAIITHKVRGTFNVLYANNEVRRRDYFRLKTWSSANGWAGLTFQLDSDTTINSIKISEIGKTYEGNYDFQTEIVNPLVWSNCGNSFAGPYVLKVGKGKMNVAVPGVSPTYFEVEAGYKVDATNISSSPVRSNDCDANAYKINTVIGTTTSTQYQLY